MTSYNITDLVKDVMKSSPLPEKFDDLNEQTKARLRRQAEAEGTTAEKLYEVIKLQAAQDAADDFDPAAIAKAVRR
jgi:hypothetical protein